MLQVLLMKVSLLAAPRLPAAEAEAKTYSWPNTMLRAMKCGLKVRVVPVMMKQKALQLTVAATATLPVVSQAAPLLAAPRLPVLEALMYSWPNTMLQAM